jgi:hypothetical protein
VPLGRYGDLQTLLEEISRIFLRIELSRI